MRDTSGRVLSLVAHADASPERNKTKGHLHWVSAKDAVRATVRVYSVLFTPEDPEVEAGMLAGAAGAAVAVGEEQEEVVESDEPAATGGAPAWLKLLNPDSCTVHAALVEKALAEAAGPPDRSKDRPAFQFQRLGFFCVDTTSTAAEPIFNRVVALKEDKEKKAV